MTTGNNTQLQSILAQHTDLDLNNVSERSATILQLATTAAINGKAGADVIQARSIQLSKRCIFEGFAGLLGWSRGFLRPLRGGCLAVAAGLPRVDSSSPQTLLAAKLDVDPVLNGFTPLLRICDAAPRATSADIVKALVKCAQPTSLCFSPADCASCLAHSRL